MSHRPCKVRRLCGPQIIPLISVLLFTATPAYPYDEGPESSTVIFLPPGDLYPPYAADPHRVGFGVQWLSFTDTRIPDSGNSRVALKAGGRLGLVRFHPPDLEDRGWQASLEGGFNAQFDADYSLDNIGWDGRYGLVVTTAQSGRLAFKFGVLHDSSHVGDEYMERTGRKRIGYTRHELAAGVSWFPTEQVRTYMEAAWGYQLSNNKLQDPGRAQIGVEYESSPALWRGRMGWYAAADFSAMEERNWRVDLSAQTGLVARSGWRTWRFGIEWYNGRPPIGEFFQNTERYIGLGFWVDV